MIPRGTKHSLTRLMLLFLVTGGKSCITMDKTKVPVFKHHYVPPPQDLPTSQPDPILFKFTSYKQGPVDVKKNLVTHFQTSAAGVWENVLGPLLYGK